MAVDPFTDVTSLMEQGPLHFFEVRRRQLDQGYRLLCERSPGIAYRCKDEERYQTLYCLEHHGSVVPHQRRCAVVETDDPSPWTRIGRPSKIEVLTLVLFALAQSSGREDAAVLLSGGNQSTILGFDYGVPEEGVNYPVGTSLLVNFPSSVTEGGTLVTLRAPSSFVLLQAENKRLSEVLYYDSELGETEKLIARRIRPTVNVVQVPRGFWLHQSLFEEVPDCPRPFEDSSLGPTTPVIEVAGLVATLVAGRANCLKRHVGCVILDLYGKDRSKGKIRSIGYNGFKSGLRDTDDCAEHFCNKRRYGGKNDSMCFSPCAEIDAIRGYAHDASIGRVFLRQTTRSAEDLDIETVAVTTIEPCERCTSILFENGIFEYHALGAYDTERTRTLQQLQRRGRVRLSRIDTPFWRGPKLRA